MSIVVIAGLMPFVSTYIIVSMTKHKERAAIVMAFFWAIIVLVAGFFLKYDYPVLYGIVAATFALLAAPAEASK